MSKSLGGYVAYFFFTNRKCYKGADDADKAKNFDAVVCCRRRRITRPMLVIPRGSWLLYHCHWSLNAVICVLSSFVKTPSFSDCIVPHEKSLFHMFDQQFELDEMVLTKPNAALNIHQAASSSFFFWDTGLQITKFLDRSVCAFCYS